MMMFAFENRIIPMRVGTRITYVTAEISKQDHPHACGDKVSVDDALAKR